MMEKTQTKRKKVKVIDISLYKVWYMAFIQKMSTNEQDLERTFHLFV